MAGILYFTPDQANIDLKPKTLYWQLKGDE